jgi:hypothetical protein
MGSPRVVVVLAWVYVLLLPLAGAAELAGLIDHAIGRGRQWCLTATLSGQRGKQAKKIIFARFSPPPAPTSLLLLWLTTPRYFILSILSSLQLYNTIGILLPLAVTAQHRNPSAAPLSQQSSTCLRSLTPPSRVCEYLAFLFPLLKHDGTRCASSPSCWLCRASRILPKTVSTPFQLACAESGFKVLSEIVFHHGN